MAGMPIDGFDAYHYAARKKQTLKLYHDQYRPASVGTGWNETAGKATTFTRGLLRNQSFSNFTQTTPMYSRNKPLNCYHGGYTYRLISWLLRRLLCEHQVSLNDI